jgi:hypothetical protein
MNNSESNTIFEIIENTQKDIEDCKFILDRRISHLTKRIVAAPKDLSWDRKEVQALTKAKELISDIYNPNIKNQIDFWTQSFTYFVREQGFDLTKSEDLAIFMEHMYACIKLKPWTKNISVEETLDAIADES